MPRSRLILASAIVAAVVLVPRGVGPTAPATDVVIAPIQAPTNGAAAAQRAAPDCDPAAALFATLFAQLAGTALTNAGIGRDALDAQLVADRELFRSYLARLGIQLDQVQLDALMAGFATASATPATSLGAC